jgi:hypothetical protein
MQRPDGRLALGLLAAGALSFLAGMGLSVLIGLIPCQGEELVCGINEAVGGYAVIIWAILGPAVFGLALTIARNHVTLASALGVLLTPLIAFLLITQIEHVLYIGFEPQRQFRSFLTTFVPPALTVLVQYLILRLVVPRAQRR